MYKTFIVSLLQKSYRKDANISFAFVLSIVKCISIYVAGKALIGRYIHTLFYSESVKIESLRALPDLSTLPLPSGVNELGTDLPERDEILPDNVHERVPKWHYIV